MFFSSIGNRGFGTLFLLKKQQKHKKTHKKTIFPIHNQQFFAYF